MSSPDFQAEQAFARTFLGLLSRQPITYNDDYHQPLESSLKRVPVLQVSTQPIIHGSLFFVFDLVVDSFANSFLVPLSQLTHKW